jgi:predicted Zn-dependent peptidase
MTRLTHLTRGIIWSRAIGAVGVSLALVAAPPAFAGAQGTKAVSLDRSAIPTAGPTPELHVPSWSKLSLANGARLIVSERHGLPLVYVSVNFVGGAAQFEPADKTGLANFVSSMMLEGTTTRTGDQLSAAMQNLGSNVSVFIGPENGSMGVFVMKDKLEPMLAILEDVLVNPSFPEAALERLRGRTLISLQQQRDRTAGIAAVVFPKVLYTTDEPYGRSMTEASAKAITRADLVKFHDEYFEPGRAEITVVGDITPADAKRMLDSTLASWPAGGSNPSFDYPTPPAPKPTTIYLVDKPGAAQSTFAIGEVGPPRSTPDYYALRVLNSFFGELFQSRLNANIREQKGYSYGVSSRFAYGRGPGAFRAGGEIVTAKSDSALIEFMKEIKGIRGERPITDEEMQAAKNALIQSLPARFASVGGVSGSISEIYTQDLPEDYYQSFVTRVNAVTKNDVLRVAQKYIDPDHLAIVIVGDKAKIDGPLAATKIAPIAYLDVNGDPVGTKVTP